MPVPSSWPTRQWLPASPEAPTSGALPPASLASSRREKVYRLCTSRVGYRSAFPCLLIHGPKAGDSGISCRGARPDVLFLWHNALILRHSAGAGFYPWHPEYKCLSRLAVPGAFVISALPVALVRILYCVRHTGHIVSACRSGIRKRQRVNPFIPDWRRINGKHHWLVRHCVAGFAKSSDLKKTIHYTGQL
jgi:hypothetical protein